MPWNQNFHFCERWRKFSPNELRPSYLESKEKFDCLTNRTDELQLLGSKKRTHLSWGFEGVWCHLPLARPKMVSSIQSYLHLVPFSFFFFHSGFSHFNNFLHHLHILRIRVFVRHSSLNLHIDYLVFCHCWGAAFDVLTPPFLRTSEALSADSLPPSHYKEKGSLWAKLGLAVDGKLILQMHYGP